MRNATNRTMLLVRSDALLSNTMESRFFEPPREMEIGSKNQDFKKLKVAVEITLDSSGIIAL